MNKSSIPWQAKQIAKMYDNNCLRFDNVRQRGEVWENYRKSLFIDSTFRDYPIPPIYAIKTDETVKTSRGEASVFDCIDGKQRCTTISQFRSNEFALIGLEPIVINDEEVDINGLTYDELPEELRDAFDSTPITVYFFTEISDDEVSEMMDRLNNGRPMGGVVKARIKSKDLESIISLGSHPLLAEYLTTKAFLGYNNEDIVIKTYLMTTQDSPCFEFKYVQDVYLNHKFEEDEINNIKNLFDKSHEVFSLIENEAPKETFRKIIKKTNMLAIIGYINVSEEDVPTIASKIQSFFTTEDVKVLSKSEVYNEASLHATNRSPQILLRNSALEEFCRSFNG